VRWPGGLASGAPTTTARPEMATVAAARLRDPPYPQDYRDHPEGCLREGQQLLAGESHVEPCQAPPSNYHENRPSAPVQDRRNKPYLVAFPSVSAARQLQIAARLLARHWHARRTQGRASARGPWRAWAARAARGLSLTDPAVGPPDGGGRANHRGTIRRSLVAGCGQRVSSV
jgi:hypothetical protein